MTEMGNKAHDLVAMMTPKNKAEVRMQLDRLMKVAENDGDDVSIEQIRDANESYYMKEMAFTLPLPGVN